MRYHFSHVASRLFDTPLAMLPDTLRGILDIVGYRIITGEAVHDERGKTFGETKAEVMTRRLQCITGGEVVSVGRGMGQYARAGGIAVVPIIGPLSQRFDFMAELCGFATYEGIKETINAAISDASVKGVLLDIDSPGGEVRGLFDLSGYIHGLASTGDKPIWSSANGMACSAAYALASSAEKFYTSQGSPVGSIGVVMVHADYTEQDKAIGVKYTAIYSGAHKVDGWSHAALPEDVMKAFKADADEMREAFAATIGEYGRLTKQEALATEASVYRDKKAAKNKLVDGVKSFDDTLEAMQGLVSRSRPANSGRTASAQSVKDNTMNVNNPAGGTPADQNISDTKVPDSNSSAADAARADALASENLRISSIMDMCELAGMSALAAGYVRDKTMTIDKVRADLLKAKADNSDGRHVDPNKGSNAAASSAANNHGWNAIIDRVNSAHGVQTRTKG